MLEIQKTKTKHASPIAFNKKWLGSISVEASLKEQEQLKQQAKEGKFHFIGFEPTQPVITKGLRTTEEDIVWDAKQLKQASISELDLRRGGQATLHTPGQLVIYPIVSLPLLGIKIKDFILTLESITQEVLKDLGITTQSLEEYAGLSTSKGKMAFFGIHVSEGVSQHGLSINLSNDLSLFSSIKSCGVSNRKHDKLISYDIHLTAEELFDRWIEKALSVLGSE